MQRGSYSLTEGSIWKSMMVFAFPVLLSNLLQLFYDTFDAWTVGYFLGDTALAAVGAFVPAPAGVLGAVLGYVTSPVLLVIFSGIAGVCIRLVKGGLKS